MSMDTGESETEPLPIFQDVILCHLELFVRTVLNERVSRRECKHTAFSTSEVLFCNCKLCRFIRQGPWVQQLVIRQYSTHSNNSRAHQSPKLQCMQLTVYSSRCSRSHAVLISEFDTCNRKLFKCIARQIYSNRCGMHAEWSVYILHAMTSADLTLSQLTVEMEILQVV